MTLTMVWLFGTRWPSLSNSGSADLLFNEKSNKQKKKNTAWQKQCYRNDLLMRIARLVQADRKLKGTRIATLYRYVEVD